MAFLLSFPHLLLASFFFFVLLASSSNDTLLPTHSIKDGETLVSAGKTFALGFFSPEKTSNRYVGIWYHNVPDQNVVWVANRENPLPNASGSLTIINDNLVILDKNRRVIWSARNATDATDYTSARLMDSGNLVVRDKEGRIVWESFDYPTNTLLPGMKIGIDRRSGLDRFLTSWKSPTDPAQGSFSLRIDPRGVPEFFLWKQGLRRIWRSGPWNGQRFSGVPGLTASSIYSFTFVSNENEAYFTVGLRNPSVIARMVLDVSGQVQGQIWSNHQWNFFLGRFSICDRYGECGRNSCCNCDQDLTCECLRGFEPRSPKNWLLKDWSDGCGRMKPAECGEGDTFFRLEHVKLPDTSHARADMRASLKDCEDECLKNCSCTAFSSADISGGGSGCFMWGGDLVDMQVYDGEGQDIHIRVVASELQEKGVLNKKRIILIPTVISGLIFFTICFCVLHVTNKKRKGHKIRERQQQIFSDGDDFEDTKGQNLPLFELNVIAAATNNFSSENKLGEGGFGPVYKGELMNGIEIAVKRLSQKSGQGSREFKNEVMLIAKLQHRNLVRILGCCIQGEEMMLIYEYMRNKSLDSFIFDETRRALLHWSSRFQIIMGIARGVLYLHEDSRLRIIHRDLKASNVLLDDEMNPRISDFGMARIFGGNQTHLNTNRVVGTYGYMAPEYAMNGLFSPKSDVFSFGVLLLEIINGKRNSGSFIDDPYRNLIIHAWELWQEGRDLEIVDPMMAGASTITEVKRCIQVGLLCVQEKAMDRPTMVSVVFMLANDMALPTPRKPAFYVGNRFADSNLCTSGIGSCSINEVTVTDLHER